MKSSLAVWIPNSLPRCQIDVGAKRDRREMKTKKTKAGGRCEAGGGGSRTNGGNGGGQREPRRQQGRAENERNTGEVLARELGRKGLWVVEVMGCSVFSSHACPRYLERPSFFSSPPIYQGVRCGIQMAVWMFREQLRDLGGRSLMSSL